MVGKAGSAGPARSEITVSGTSAGRELYPCNLHITWYFSGNASLNPLAGKAG